MFESQHQFERFMCCLPAIFLYPRTSKVCWNRTGWLGSDIWLNNYWHRGQLKLELWSWKQQRRQFVIQGKIKKRWWFQIFFICTPTWGNDAIWLYNHFWSGLKPPTRGGAFKHSRSLASHDQRKEWFQTFCLTLRIGEMIQFDEHIVQMSWFNHQLENNWTEGPCAIFVAWILCLGRLHWGPNEYPLKLEDPFPFKMVPFQGTCLLSSGCTQIFSKRLGQVRFAACCTPGTINWLVGFSLCCLEVILQVTHTIHGTGIFTYMDGLGMIFPAVSLAGGKRVEMSRWSQLLPATVFM